MIKCENCEKEFETEAQLRGHKMKCRPQRQERVPFGAKEQRFSDLNLDQNYCYRVFNDNWRKEPSRIQRALDAGYEVVEHGQSGATVGTNDDGTEIKGVLMRIPREFHEQDQALREAQRAKVDEQINRGKYQENAKDGRYIPGDGIHMETKLTP